MLTLPIRESVEVTPRATIIRLDLGGQPFSYRAGQAALLQPQGTAKPRPYSIASAPEQSLKDGLLEFLVQTDAAGTTGVPKEAIRTGTLVDLEGPLGSFQFPEHPVERRFLFIAGGTGIAPLRSMLWHVLLAERDGHIELIYSVRSPEEFAYLDEFERLAAAGRIAFHHTVTRSASEGWTGRLGRIDATYLTPLVDAGHTLCFVCGPPALVGEIPQTLLNMGIRRDQILIEQWT
ncbi:MAG TPA: FAD-binding oxidoreductase [Vicinamibacterales bacterium]|jgi:NAD(P)H-flavin reductase|nr:FAD-binding oxidoreductase [Vicinamibacterales bacterium]